MERLLSLLYLKIMRQDRNLSSLAEGKGRTTIRISFCRAFCTNTSKELQAQRCIALYHSAIAHIYEINDICSKNDYYQFADKLVRQGRGFWHLLCMDSAQLHGSKCLLRGSRL